VDRICPYLALADDGRTVADGFDPEHQCHALTPPAPLERARQVQLCLTEAHTRCERFSAARTAWLAASSGLPRVASDVDFGRTRLILEPEPSWRNLAGAPRSHFSRRTIVVGALGAAAVTLLVLGSAFGLFVGVPAPSATPTPTASASVAASPTASPVASISSEPSVSIAPTVTPPPTPGPTPRTYIVQSGDSLNSIAARFTTTAQAIADASGIKVTDTISPGQVLIIP
jgi:hypothetical protein